MEANPKRHKRSGSTGAGSVTHSAGARRSTKRYTGGPSYGKFQGVKPKAEKKNFDTDIVAAGLTTLPSLATATTYCLNLFNTGATAVTVSGRHAVMKSMLLRLAIQSSGNGWSAGFPAAAKAQPTAIRVLVVYDRQPSGALASIGNILGTTTYGTASPLNLGTSDRFSVLMDEKYSIGGYDTAAAATSQQYPPGVFVDRYVKIGLPCEAGSTAFTGAIGGITTGAIVLLAFTDVAAANGPPTVVAGMSRIRFTDA